jgi:glycosyltransferase involved in cell wall biosynthesis
MSSPSRPRVALLGLHFAEYTIRLAAAVQRAHADVLLVTYADVAASELGPEWERHVRGQGLEVLILQRPRHPGQVLNNAWRLRRSLRSFAVSTVHVQEALRDEIVLALGTMPDVPMVLTVHDPAPHLGLDSERLRDRRRRFCRDWLRRRARYAITHGQALADGLVDEVPTLAGEVRIAAHGPLGGPPSTAPVPVDPVRLLFFGRVEAYKGLGHFVEAVRRLRERGLRVEGVVAGRGTDLERHRAAMDAAGGFDVRDRFIPPAEVSDLFGSCTAVVLPYIEGTQSGVAAMALGFGRGVFATRVGAIPELVQHGVSGLLVPPADVDALVNAIAAAAAEPGAFQRLCDGACRLATGERGWSSIAAVTAAVYEEARPPDRAWRRARR